MTKFLDGPAAGKVLALRRAPVMLRVVKTRSGDFDALDRPDDMPMGDEVIFVYRLASKPTAMHLNCRGKNRAAGGYYPVAEYSVLTTQPSDPDVRDNKAWGRWCDANRDDLMPEWAKAEGGVP